MKRIMVDFNTMMQDVEQGNRVILGTDDRPGLPLQQQGERVVAFDDELEVEGVVEHEGLFWLAALDLSKLKRFTPAQ